MITLLLFIIQFNINLCDSMMNTAEIMNDNMTYVLYPMDDKGVSEQSSFNFGMFLDTTDEYYGVKFVFVMVNQVVVGLIKKLSLQDLEDEFRYKIPVSLLPLEIPPWRDKQQANIVLHLAKNSRSNSLEVEENDVGEFLAYIKTVMNCKEVMVKQHGHAKIGMSYNNK